jgi:hypothetical protein
LTRNTVDLSNISQAIFAPSIGTTANGSVASPALGYTAEDVANKQNSLAVDGTGAKYTTVDAVNAGLNTKISGSGTTNQIAKFTGSGTVGNSSIFDNGTNVGIGTNNPETKLQVSNTSGLSEIRNTGGTSSFKIITGSGFTSFGSITNDPLVIVTNDVEKIRVLNSGNLGIGTSSPTEKLDVAGNGKFSGTVTASPAELETELATLGQVTAASSRPYKVYTALLTQSGTNAPVATVLENTLGAVPTLSRNATSSYSIITSGLFTSNKTFVIINQTNNSTRITANVTSTSNIGVETPTLDGVLNKTSIEIRVYN